MDDVILPIFSLIEILILGAIITKGLSIKIPSFSFPFFVISLGSLIFTAINYFCSLLFSFPNGIIIGQFLLLGFEIIYLYFYRPRIDLINICRNLIRERYLLFLLLFIGIILISLFNNHTLNNLDGNFYTGDSAYGDLPFHLGIISQIAYGNQFPPENPLYQGISLVYPYLIDFLSAILVYEGMSLRNSIVIPGLLLAISLVGLIYDFCLIVTQNRFKGFLSTLLFFFNGGLDFYFFLKVQQFKPSNILIALSQPSPLTEYPHLFNENIPWCNFLSRILIPERSLLLGIPAGLIILRLLFFRNKKINFIEILLVAFLLSLLPILHTHTLLAMAVIVPILVIWKLRRNYSQEKLSKYVQVTFISLLLVIPFIPMFVNHIENTGNFFKLHFGWMVGNNESIIWFWLKNSFLYIPLSLFALFIAKTATPQTKILQFCGLALFLIVNIVLISPYDWDNVKLLFWAGIFFALGASEFFYYLYQKKKIITTILASLILLTMTSSALLSIRREVQIKHLLFSQSDINLSEYVKKNTPTNSIFLTYKIHNSPISNLAGRKILMGFTDSLWVHGINYSQREQDINQMFRGDLELIKKYKVDYIVLSRFNPSDYIINRDYFKNLPIFYSDSSYIVYQIN